MIQSPFEGWDRRFFRSSLVLALSAGALACSAADSETETIANQDDEALLFSSVQFSKEEWNALKRFTPLGKPPADPTNRYADDKKAQRLGQRLFFDTKFSGPLKVASDLGAVGETGKVSCASCHSGPSLDDRRSAPRTVSVGTDFHTRNAPGLVNSSFYRWTNWGGRFSAQWELSPPVAENAAIMNSNRLKIAHRIFDRYKKDYEEIFGALEPALGSDPLRFPAEGKPKPAPTEANPNPPDGPWELMAAADREIVNRIFANYGKALEAYIRQLVSGDSRFDWFVAGIPFALRASEQRGAKLFVGKARCAGCHSGPHFSDDSFHNLGVPQSGDHVPATDDGRFKDVPPLLASPFNSSGAFSDDPTTGRLDGLTNPMPEEVRGAFRTADLRGVANTAPYMHSGQLATLEDVVEFYDQGGGTPATGTKEPRLRPLGLSSGEKSDLVAFLKSLTGTPVAPRLLKDTSASE